MRGIELRRPNASGKLKRHRAPVDAYGPTAVGGSKRRRHELSRLLAVDSVVQESLRHAENLASKAKLKRHDYVKTPDGLRSPDLCKGRPPYQAVKVQPVAGSRDRADPRPVAFSQRWNQFEPGLNRLAVVVYEANLSEAKNRVGVSLEC